MSGLDLQAIPAADVRVDAAVFVYRLYDIGYEVNLEKAAERLAAGGSERRRPARIEAQTIHIANLPVFASLGTVPLTLGGHTFESRVTARVYEFAVACLSIELRLPRELPWSALREFALAVDLVRDTAEVLDRSLVRLTDQLGPAVSRPAKSSITEDFVVYRVSALRDAQGGAVSGHSLRDEDLTAVLLGERDPLAEAARRELLPHRFSYYTDDLAIVTWYGALIVEPSPEDIDVQYVLELANAQLLELRVYDDALDRELTKVYARIAAMRTGPTALLGRRYAPLLGHLQSLVADTSEFVERVENAFKVTDDVYLARIYSAALEVFGGRTWRSGIDRKLDSLRDTYTMLSEEARAVRAEVLELAIILLIVAEIVIGLFRH